MTTATAAARRSRREASSGGIGKTIMGVPARFMRPRLILIVTACALVLFGLLMIYSASSVKALSSFGDAAYYLKRQALFVAIGAAAAVGIARSDYHRFSAGMALKAIWAVTVLILLATAALGLASHGAVRWITIAGQSIQPSEFAKITVILTAANLLERYFETEEIDFRRLLALSALGVGLPVVLILAQPDKGTTIILVATIIVMLYLAGVPGRWLARIVIAGVVVTIAVSMRDDYSRQRILTLFDPWADPYGDGYQLIQGFYAFGSGGLFGLGLGLSRQKYSYLPEAHNDFIFAIVGEELGLVGTLGVVIGFGVFVYMGVQIARYAPDLTGKLIAAGCTSLIAIQFLVNVMGVLGMTPLTGKPLPFLSYGGSSIISCLLLVGLIVSVSCQSRLPETDYETRRRSMDVVSGQRAGRRGSTGVAASPFVLVDGGSTLSEPSSKGRAKGRARSGGSAPRSGGGGYQRVDLGPTAAERLRGGSSGPRVRDPGSTGNLGGASRRGTGRSGAGGRGRRK